MEERIYLIRDALGGAGLRHHDARVYPYMLVDYLSLLLQRDLVVTLWRRDKAGRYEPWFTNARDPRLRRLLGGYPRVGRRRRQNPPPPWPLESGKPTGGFWHACDLKQNVIVTVLQPPDSGYPKLQSSDLAALENLFRGSWVDGLNADLLRCARDRGHLRVPPSGVRFGRKDWQKPWQKMSWQQDQGETPSLPFDLRDGFQVGLEAYIDAFLSEHQLDRARELASLHFCIKSVEGSAIRYNEYPHTLRLLITRHQADAFRTALKREASVLPSELPSDPEQLLEILRRPLGNNSASIGDACLESGCLQFGHHAGSGWDEPGDKADICRQKLEAHFYRLLSPHADVAESNLFYAPIHVNGVPWLGCFTFTGPTSSDDMVRWRHNYRLYRDVIHEFGSGVREHVSRIYFQAVTKALSYLIRQVMPDVAGLAKAINRQLVQLARICPLPLLQVVPEASVQGASLSIRTMGTEGLALVMEPNPFFDGQVDYGLMTWGQITAVCEPFLQSAHNAMVRERSEVSAYTAHLFKTPVSQLRTYVDRIPAGPDRENAAELVSDLQTFNEFSDYLISDENQGRLNEARTGAGLGALVRSETTDFAVRWDRMLNTSVPSRSHIQTTRVPGGPLRISTVYLKSVLALLLSNALRHGDERNLRVQLIPRGEQVWLRIANRVAPADAGKLRQRLPLLNEGRTHTLGINTLHLAVRVFFRTRPTYTLHRVRGRSFLAVEVPVATSAP